MGITLNAKTAGSCGGTKAERLNMKHSTKDEDMTPPSHNGGDDNALMQTDVICRYQNFFIQISTFCTSFKVTEFMGKKA